MSENIKNDDMEIDLIKLFKDVLSRLWIIIISFIVCVAATVFYLLNTTPIYEASASMMVEPLSDTSISSLFEAGFSSSSDIATELEILNSRSTYENAIRKLDLSRYTTSDGIRYSDLESPLSDGIRYFDLESPLSYEGLRNSVTVESVSGTSYLKITVQNTDPVFARDFCNALAESYSEVLTGITRNSASNQLAFITSEIPNVEEALRNATRELSDFQCDNDLLQLSAENQILLHQMSYLTMVKEPLRHEVGEAERYLSTFETSYPALKERREAFGTETEVVM